MKAQV